MKSWDDVAMPGFWKVLRGYGRYWRAIGVIVALLFVGSLFDTVALLLLIPIAAAVATGTTQLNTTLSGITLEADARVLVWVAIGAVIFSAAIRFATLHLQTRLLVVVERDQRHRIYTNFLKATWATQSAEPPGRFQWATNLSTGYSNLLGTILSSTKFVINVAVMLAAAFLVSPVGAFAIVAIGSILYFALQPLLRAARSANRLVLAASKTQNQVTAEAVVMAGQIKAFGVTERYLERLMFRTRQVLKAKRKAQLLGGSVPIVYQAVALLVALSILAYATVNPIDVPALGAVALLLFRSLSSAQGIQSALVRYAEFRPVLDNVEEWNATYESNKDDQGWIEIDRIDSVEMVDVEFRYGGTDPAVEITSMSLKPGDDVGLVGPSGAGKSTLAHLLLRFRSPSSGHYLVNGHDARDIATSSFVREVAHVPQSPVILRGTIQENISMFRDGLSRERVVEAAKHAGIDSWVSSLPEGYDTLIGPDTHGFSGGQAQRLSIARALAGRPSLLVLDEPTSALDVDSEELVTVALRGLPEHVIVVLIAHRMSTLRYCNRIVVLEDGRVTATGGSAEALETNAYFRRAVGAGALSSSTS